MTNEQFLIALAALPTPELLQASKITDALGTDAYYSARTVVVLLAAAIAQERGECAKVCESVNNFDNPMTANDCAAAIRARGK